MKHRLLSLLVACMMVISGFAAITYSLNESFESGISASWSQENVNNTSAAVIWVLDESSANPTGAKDGDHRVALRAEDNSEPYCVRLITPVLDLSAVNNPQLSFAYAQPKRGGQFSDTLSVYYRTSSTGEWQLVRKFEDYQALWAEVTITLPAAAKVATCQLAFEGKLDGGYGVVLDQVQVYPESQCMDAEFTAPTPGSTAYQLNWAPRSGRTFELIVSASAITDPSSYDTSAAIFYANDITVNGQLIPDLTPGTHYYAYLRTDCDDNKSGYTQWVSTDFVTSIGVPYTPNLAAIPSAWTQMKGAAGESVEASTLSANSSYYVWAATSNTSVLGAAHLFGRNDTGTPSWLITPSIDLEGVTAPSVLLSFKLALTNGESSTTASSYASTSKFHVYVSADGGDTWDRVRTIEGAELTTAGLAFSILLDEYKDAGSIRLAFVSEAASYYSTYFHLGNLSITESDGSCLGISGLKAVPTANSISLSWSVIGSTNGAVAVISESANFSDTLEVKDVTAPAASFSGLEPNMTYYVSVRQDCENAEPLTAEVQTPCLPLTITADAPWSEGFEDYTGAAYNANGVAPACWAVSADGTIKPHVIGSGSYYYKHNGTKALTFYGNGNCYAALPYFTAALNTLQLSFWMQVENANYGTLTLGYITAGDDNMSTFQPIATYPNVAGSMAQRSTDLSSVPAEATRLVFRWYYSSQYSCCIDDIEISLLPDCRRVQGVDASDLTPNSANLSFTLNDAASYDVLVVTKAMNPDTLTVESLIAFRDTVTAGPVAVEGLTSYTTYYAYVRALCGDEERGEWSEVKSFTTLVGLPFAENFDALTSGIPAGWSNSEGSGYTTYKWTSYATGHEGKCLRFDSYSNSNGNTNVLALPSIYLSADAQLSFWWKNPTGGAGLVLIAEEGQTNRDTLKSDLTGISSWTEYTIDLTAYTGKSVVIYFHGTSNYGPSGAYLDLDDVLVEAIPSCDKMGALELVSAANASATLRYAATNASQYQVVVSTESIDPASADLTAANVVYNQLVASTQPEIPSLEGNTRYYAYVRGFCGGTDYSAWSSELSFKTLCNAITPADFGLETFNDPASADCWSFGFGTPGTSTSSAYAKRDSTKAYGGYIKLSKESVAYTKNAAGVDTVYSDGAYALSPELELGEDSIQMYQVSFMAATTSQVATNYKRLNVGVMAGLSDIQIIKTIDLDYAADSTALKSYTVSFASAQKPLFDLGQKWRVIFQLNEPAKHDSTNFVLIDNVALEAASNCEQIMETKIDSVGVNGARISWEDSEAGSYEVMLASVNSLRPDTISAKIRSEEVSTNSILFTGLESNTKYYAYVRAICGEGDSAKWSNSLEFRTSIAVPYLEPFSATTLNEGWQAKCYYSSSMPDSIAPSVFTESTSYTTWRMTSMSLPAGMSGYAAVVEPVSQSAAAWLLSPVIDMTENASDFIELSFKMAGNNISTYGYVALYISVDGGAYKPLATWASSGATNSISEITSADSTYAINLTKYAGKRISLVWGTYQYSSSTRSLYIDDIDIHTTSANCRGIASVAINPTAEEAIVSWEIEGTPVKAEVMISDTANFFTHIDSVGVEDALEHTFANLTPNTLYYVRVRQLDCENAEWVVKSFKTSCSPIAAAELPWSEGFESMTLGSESADAPECWSLLNANDGAYPYIFVNNSTGYVLSGSKSLYFKSSNSRYGYAILPAFETPLNEMVIDFSYKDESATSSGYLDLGYMTNITDEKSFVSIAQFNRSTSWVTVTGQMLDSIPDAVASSARLAFRYGGASNNYYLGIDDITVRLIPGCPDMAGLAVDSIVADSARLYIDNLGAAGYHFVVATAEIDLNDLSEADAAKIILNDSVYGDTAVFVDGLQPAKMYYVYARTLCDDEKVGAWSNPVSFISACAVFTVADGNPFVENFNTLTSGIPACWDNSRGTTTTASYRWNYNTSGYDGACLMFNSYSNSNGNTDTLVTPELHLAEDAILSFYWKNAAGGAASVLISADGGATKTVLESAMTSKSSWTLYEKNLSEYTGQTVSIYFASTSNYGSSGAYHYLDNVKVATIPACQSATGLKFELTEGDGTIASLSWDKGEAASWKIQYATSADFADAIDSTASDTSFIALTGLAPETMYYARVKNVCEGGAESEWTDAISFKPTNALSMVINNGTTTNDYVPIYGYYVDLGCKSQFVIPADSLVAMQWDSITQLTFYASNASVDWGAAKFEVYMAEVPSASLSALADWDAMTKVMNAGSLSISGNQMVVTLDQPYQYTDGNLLIGFKQTTNGSYVSCNWYGKTLNGASIGGSNSAASQQNFLPKMKIEYLPGEAPACIKPTGLKFELTEGDGTIASLSWDKGEAASWKIQYATSADFADAIDSTASDTSFIALTGLAPETMYYARVKNVCEGGAESEWTDAISFKPTNALSMVINNGTTTNDYVPIYGYYVDLGCKSQFVIPADSLVAMQWDSITQLTFYASNASVDWGAAKFEVYMAEVPSASLSALADWDAMTKVMNAGSLSISGNQMVVTLDQPYQYTDGNLLIGFKQTTNGSYVSCNWYGKTLNGASIGGSNSAASQQNFLPKMKIEYVPGVEPACIKPSNLAVAKIGAASAELNFKESKAPEYEVVLTNAAIGPDTLALVADTLIVLRDTVDTNFVAINGLQQSTDYYVYVRGLCTETEMSEWINTQFTTRCLAAIPYVENFDDQSNRKPVYAGTSSYTIPSCWNEGYTSTSYVSRIDDNSTYSTYAFSGTSALRLYSYYYYSSYYYSETKATSYVVLPEMDAALDTLQLTFKARAMSDGSSVTNYATSDYAHSVKIGTMTDPEDFSTFQLLDTYVLAEVSSTPSSADNYWEDVTVYLQGATGKYIALVSDFDEKSNYVWIDDVEVSRAPDCLAPSAVKVAAGARAADVSWASIATEFEVAFGAAGFALPDGADSIYVVEDTTGLHIADLEPSTDYELYVRAVCGENAHSDWSSVASFSTACLLPEFAEYHFDDNNTRFVHHRDSIHEEDYYGYVDRDDVSDVFMENCWTVTGYEETVNTSYYDYEEYSTIYQTGKQGRYPFIIDDEGTYVYARSASGALVFSCASTSPAKPQVAVMPAMETLDRDSLQLEFWARPGYESNGTMTGATTSYARMLRVGLMTDPSDLTTFVPLRTIKEEAISGAASADPEGEKYWRRHVIDLAGTTAPFIAFVYDSTASNLFFVDDVRIKKMATCGEPAAPEVTDIEATTAVVRWEATAPAYQVALILGTDTAKYMVAGNDTLQLENLTGATTYIVKLRAFCNENDSSEWSASTAFTTECAPIATLPWSEGFDNHATGSETSDAPLCWDMLNTNLGGYPNLYVSTSASYSGSKGLYFKSASGAEDGYAILPEFEVSAEALQISFWYKHENTSYSGDLEFGYMTDITAASTFISLATCPKTTTWSQLKANTLAIPSELLGSARFAFRYSNVNSTTWYYAAVDSIRIEELDLSCLGVENLAVSEISANGARLSFRFIDGLDHDAQVAISKEAAFDDATAIEVQTISDSTYFFSLALESQTTYYLYARQDCGEGNYSEWQQVSFRTPYTIRYEAEMPTTALPADWERFSGKVDAVLAGTASLTAATSGWYATAADTILNANHIRGEIWSTSFNYWMVSPLVSLAAPANSNVALRFDAALVPYSSYYADGRNTGTDDRFAVLVSTDNGANWTKMAEWNNAGSSYVYNDIPEKAKTFNLDLSEYVGQSVRVAFYGESTVSNADNYLHFGNIVINYSVTELYQDTVCAGSDYVGAEHGNTFYVLPKNYEAGRLNTYEKYVPAANGSGLPDSILTLELNVIAMETFEDSVVLCEGEHVSMLVHGVNFEFDARLGMKDQVRYVQNEFGCENIVKLRILAVNPKLETHVYDSVAQGEEYEWHGQKYISATDVPFDTVSLITGCDSTVYLHLSVYEKQDTVGPDPHEGVAEVGAQKLIIAPNPVKIGEPIHVLNTFAAEQLAEARIEIVSATGSLVYAHEGAEQPFVLPGIQASGVYVVRIIIGEEIFISSLLVL